MEFEKKNMSFSYKMSCKALCFIAIVVGGLYMYESYRNDYKQPLKPTTNYMQEQSKPIMVTAVM